jgi:NAD(P)-dependent dehydrogenase (short-subunit alcohol dehydrogenase family)
LDILVNNAGIAHIGNIEAVEEADLDRLYNVNIKGVYNCIKASIASLKQNDGGVILNLASIASSVGINNRFAYSMTKGAVLTMTYSIAKDYITEGIKWTNTQDLFHKVFIEFHNLTN